MLSSIILATLTAYPSAWGPSGYFELISPQAMERFENRASLSIGAAVDYVEFTVRNLDSTGCCAENGAIHDYTEARVGVAYTPSNWYDLYVMLRGYQWYPYGLGTGIGGLGDADLGVKFRFLDFGMLAMGADLAVTAPTGETQTDTFFTVKYGGPDAVDMFGMSDSAFKFRGQLLAEIDFSKRSDLLAFRLVFNAGWYQGNQDLVFRPVPTGSPMDTVTVQTPLMLGGGFVISSRWLDWILEAKYYGSTDFAYPIYVSPIIRIRPFEDLGLHIMGGVNANTYYYGYLPTTGIDNRLVEWNYDIIAGIGLVTPVFRTDELKPGGTVFGKVYDAKTKEPLTAKVRVVEANLNLNTDTTGIYRVRHVPTGVYTIVAESEGYRKSYSLVHVKKRSTNVVDIPMDPAFVAIKGVAIDSITGQTVGGVKLTWTGPQNETITTTNEGFEAKLKPGSYWVLAEREGFFRKYVDVSAMDNTFVKIIMGRNLTYEPKLIKSVYFDLASARLSKKTEGALEEIAKMLVSDPSSKIIIRGHADRHGDVFYNELLSQKRAKAAKDYLLKKYDIGEDRISVEWYSEFVKVGKTDRQNRRVEIYLLVPTNPPDLNEGGSGSSNGGEEKEGSE